MPTSSHRPGSQGVHQDRSRQLARQVLGGCVSTEYQLAATEQWDDEALDVLQSAWSHIEGTAASLGFSVEGPPKIPPDTPMTGRCVMLNQTMHRLRKQCQAMLA